MNMSFAMRDTVNTCISHEGQTMPTSIRLSPDVEARLNHLAASTGRSKAFYLREIIERGLEDIEDYYLASQVLERVRAGGERVYSADAVRKELGLDD
jgi:RHH-type rel operon transcriptional repressor/antitoxin RelB